MLAVAKRLQKGTRGRAEAVGAELPVIPEGRGRVQHPLEAQAWVKTDDGGEVEER